MTAPHEPALDSVPTTGGAESAAPTSIPTADMLFAPGVNDPGTIVEVISTAHLKKAREFATGFFSALASNAAIQAELTAAIEECFRRYDTGPFENRFIVGAVVEQILGATARSLGLEVNNAGAHRQAYDLELQPGYGLSVKYTSATGRSAKVRITNSQGAVGAWNTGTIFVIAGIGIGYADEGLVPGATIVAGDGKSIDVAIQPLLRLWGVPSATVTGPTPAWLIAIPEPNPQTGYFLPVVVPARATVKSPRLAGDPIALDILQSGKSQTLLQHFRWSI